MTITQFLQDRAVLGCQWCKAAGTLDVHPHPSDDTHPGKLVCAQCGRFTQWLSKDRAEARRPGLKAGTAEQVWAAWGNACALCGTSLADLQYLGIPREVQHAPPQVDAQETGQLLPLCAWCHQHGTGQMKRMRSLVARFRETPDDPR